MKPDVLPLNEKQLKALDQTFCPHNKPFRVLADGRAVEITSGVCASKGSNIMYHPVYWDRSDKFRKQVLEYMRGNNTTVRFHVIYH